jgi:S-adenosylmethionine hydrolase
MAIVTLLTDFGLADSYVGQVKAAVLAVAPTATIVDLSHAVRPQDVFGGAFVLWSAVEAFAVGTVHLAVVDPGVGSARRGIAARSARGDVFVGPDNGLLVPALERLGGCAAAVELTEQRYWRPVVSNTFHGRDIFGPVAGHLAGGVPLEALGTPIELARPFALGFADGPRGEIVHIDTYGNLITNLRVPPHAKLRLGERIVNVRPFYAEAQPGELLALVGSSGLIEIAVRDGNAATATGACRGDPVLVVPD